MDWSEFLLFESTTYDSIDVKRIYLDMAGDLAAGVMLSQIVFYHLPDRDGANRLSFQRDGYWWMPMRWQDWHKEIRLRPGQARRAMEILTSKKPALVITDVFTIKNIPTCHLRLNNSGFLETWKRFAEVQNPKLIRKEPKLDKSKELNGLGVECPKVEHLLDPADANRNICRIQQMHLLDPADQHHVKNKRIDHDHVVVVHEISHAPETDNNNKKPAVKFSVLDPEFLEVIRNHPEAYPGVDLERAIAKFYLLCQADGKKPTKRWFLGFLELERKTPEQSRTLRVGEHRPAGSPEESDQRQKLIGDLMAIEEEKARRQDQHRGAVAAHLKSLPPAEYAALVKDAKAGLVSRKVSVPHQQNDRARVLLHATVDLFILRNPTWGTNATESSESLSDADSIPRPVGRVAGKGE